MGLSVQSIKEIGKIIVNRFKGVKYGAIKFDGGRTQLVETSKLRNACNLTTDLLGNDYIKNLGPEQAKIIEELFRLLKNSSTNLTGNGCQYLHAHGAMQVYDKTANKACLTICEKVKNPIKTWWNG